MHATSHRRQPLLRATALGLAVVYAGLASVGEGLHELAHLLGPDACHVAPADSDESLCACPCGHHESKPAEAPARTVVEAPSHDAHDCPVCQLLAQLKQAEGGDAATVETLLRVALVDSPLTPSQDSADLPTERGRGPPVAA